MNEIKMNAEDFTSLVKQLEECKKQLKELEKANKFLNDQIREYNEKFAKDTDEH